jgi:hypothetical protein
MRTLKWIVAALALAAAASPPAHAAARRTHVQNARLGAVRAAYSYRDTAFGSHDHARLKIWNGGRLIVNHPFRFALVPPVGTRALLIRQLDGTRPPEVILNQYTGGTHCCASSLIYTGARRVAVQWGDFVPDVRDVDGDGKPEFHGSNSAFDYAFGSFASTYQPVKVWRFTGAGVIDVTRAYPAEVQADMARAYSFYQSALSQHQSAEIVRGTLAGYAADGYTLGQGDQAMAVVQTAYDAGEAGTAKTATDAFWEPDFVGKLRDLLHRLGYA